MSDQSQQAEGGELQSRLMSEEPIQETATPSKRRAVAGPLRAQYDEAIETARHHEHRATYMAFRRRSETLQLQELTERLRIAERTVEAMKQERQAWDERMQEIDERDENEMVVQAEIGGCREDDDTERQMVEQLLQFEQEIDTLRNVNRHLEQETTELRQTYEKSLADKANEIISIRQSLGRASNVTPGSPVGNPPTRYGVIRPHDGAVPTLPTPAAIQTVPTANPTIPAANANAPAANSGGSDPLVNPAEAGASYTIPDPILTFNGQDPRSVAMVTGIVQEVLQRLGPDNVTVPKMRKSTNARRMAINAQKVVIGTDADLGWKRLVRKVWRDLFVVNEFDDFSSYIPANEGDVKTYNEGAGVGPGELMRLDFSKGFASSRWNKHILRQILAKVMTQRQQDQLSLPGVSEDYIMGLLEGQLKRSREAWAQYQPRFQLETHEFEAHTELVERVGKQRHKRLGDVGGRANRQRKLEKRTKTVTRIIAIKCASGAADLRVWEYFREILQKLSINGMSSEEEDTENFGNLTVSVFRVKFCEWRAPEIDTYLSIIDKTGTAILGSKGPRAAPRIKTNTPGKSKAPVGLPKKMYRSKWLEKMESERPFYVRDELQVSEEVFDLLMLATANV